ncbi:hypothetical protein K1719_023690 [Acacia pycnantha]|nr:hypothetical protein K1719_023690 [Acacia pycnantha]
MAMVFSSKALTKVPLSREEDDLLLRSAKKIKNGEFNISNMDWPKVGMMNQGSWSSGQSFADKLKGINEDGKNNANIVNSNDMSDDAFSETDGEGLDKEDKTMVGKIGTRGDGTGNEDAVEVVAPGGMEEVSMSTEIDSWKVVKKPRRLKKNGKEKVNEKSRQGEGGSRFGILGVVDGEVGGGDSVNDGSHVVPNVSEGVELIACDEAEKGTQRKKGESKNERKKKWSKSQSINVMGNNSRDQEEGRQDMKREKRARDIVRKGSDSKEDLRAKYLQGDLHEVNDGGSVGVIEGKEMEMDPVGDNLLGLDSFGSEAVDNIGDGERLGGLEGKFWAEPSLLDPDPEREMVDCGPRGEVVGTVVPETQAKSQIESLIRQSDPSILLLSETKTEAESPFRCLAKLGFDEWDFVPSLGRSGGLLAAWRKDRVAVSVLCKNRQFINLRCLVRDAPPIMITAVYSVPSPGLKQLLWDDLKNISGSVSEPWVVIGDFNEVLLQAERVGGAAVSLSRMQKFQDRVSGCLLSDLGFVGPRFTWRGPAMANCNRLFERLDRALANSDFLAAFSDAKVQWGNITRLFSVPTHRF